MRLGMSPSFPARWVLFFCQCFSGDLRDKLLDVTKPTYRVAVHLRLVVCAQGDPTNSSITKNRMVGAVSDIQLWCLGLPIELRQSLRLCMVMHVLRKIFILWVTLIFCGVNDLYKIKRTLERRNHTTKIKVDAHDYHAGLLLSLWVTLLLLVCT